MGKTLSRDELISLIISRAEPLAHSLGLDIWGVEVIGAGRPLVRVYVEGKFPSQPIGPELSEGTEPAKDTESLRLDSFIPQAEPEAVGAGIDQCTSLSRLLSLSLDVEDGASTEGDAGLFPEAWTLEISTPGLERVFFQLDQMRAYVGRQITILLWDAHPDFGLRKKFQGELLSVSEQGFTLSFTGADEEALERSFAWKSVRKAHLIHIFPDTSKPGGKAKAGKGGGSKA